MHFFITKGDRHGSDHMVVGFTTTYAISAINITAEVKKTHCHDIIGILLKVTLNTITPPPPHQLQGIYGFAKIENRVSILRSKYKYNLIYSQTCTKRSPLGQRKNGLIRQVTFLKEVQCIWNFLTGQEKCDLLTKVTA